MLGLTPRVGDGHRDSLDLDPVDADGLHRLSCRGELRRVQRYQAPRWSNFSESPFLPPAGQRPLGAGRLRGCGGDSGGGGGHCRRDGVRELHRLPLPRRRFENDLRRVKYRVDILDFG